MPPFLQQHALRVHRTPFHRGWLSWAYRRTLSRDKEVPFMRSHSSHTEGNVTSGILPCKAAPSEIIGQVMSAEANFVRVRVLSSDTTSTEIPMDVQTRRQGVGMETCDLLCVVRSVLKKIRNRVLVGDFVKVSSIDWTDERGMVSEVLARQTELADPPVANINHILVLLSILDPPFEALQATRFLVEAETTGVPVTLAVNKIDLASLESAQDLKERVSDWGYEAQLLSCQTGDGLHACADLLKGRISAVIGPSGVGKSSLINALRSEHQMTAQAIGEVSSIGRGRHTTRTVSFLELPGGGFLVDTPGFNRPDLSMISCQSLQTLFPEIRNLKDDLEGKTCGFANCQHIFEPDCVVNTLDWERYPVYARLHGEIKERETYERRVLQLSKKRREGHVKRKSGKAGRIKEEALLEAKRHRRVSRRRESQDLQDLVDEAVDDAGDALM